MELPKNVTQMGETDAECKIYIEDYVYSYMKQLGKKAKDKPIAIALYGDRRTEEGITYLFIYGANRLPFIQREAKYLSQAVLVEAEKQRKRFFQERIFLGYCVLEGEPVSEIVVYERGELHPVEGYVRFYEKNDRMLQVMLEENKNNKPEVNSMEKYEMVRNRQQERKRLSEQYRFRRDRGNEPEKSSSDKSMRFLGPIVAAGLGLACIYYGATGFQSEEVRKALSKVTDFFTTENMTATDTGNHAGKVVAESSLAEIIKQENEGTDDIVPVQGTDVVQSFASIIEEIALEPEPAETPAPTPTSTEVPSVSSEAEPPAELKTHIVKRGDTLLGICKTYYGTEDVLVDICGINNIGDADDIKVGQKILLP